MNRELLPGLFLEITPADGRIAGARLSLTPAVGEKEDTPLARAIDRFLNGWRCGIHAPLDDALFLFPDALEKWAPLLLRLKNDITPGRTINYRELGAPLGIHPRTVGMAMARNPFPLLIPCHRVVGIDGRMTGFSAAGGLDTKRRLLAFEQRPR